MNREMVDLDHFYLFGDVYETLETCDRLSTLLGRLRRQNLLSEDDLARTRRGLEAIRERVQDHLNAASLIPRGQRL
jgi:hypothetical protein